MMNETTFTNENPTSISNETFRYQTIYIVEQIYRNCTFESCTIVIRNNSHFGISDCRFISCNWHVDFLFSQENKNIISALKAIIGMIEENKPSYHREKVTPN
jgi:hypothetical protein